MEEEIRISQQSEQSERDKMKMRMKAKEMKRMGQLSRPRLLEEQSEGRDL